MPLWGNAAHPCHCLATGRVGKSQHRGVMNHPMTTAHKWKCDRKTVTLGAISISKKTWENSVDSAWARRRVFHQPPGFRTKAALVIWLDVCIC